MKCPTNRCDRALFRWTEVQFPPAEAGGSHQQMSARASSEIPPFVAWHSGRQNSTGRWTSFCVIAYTGRFGEGIFGRKATSIPSHLLSAVPEKKTCGERSRTMGHPQFQNQKRRPIKYTNGLATRQRDLAVGLYCSGSFCRLRGSKSAVTLSRSECGRCAVNPPICIQDTRICILVNGHVDWSLQVGSFR
jgi:hypothetical protein